MEIMVDYSPQFQKCSLTTRSSWVSYLKHKKTDNFVFEKVILYFVLLAG